MAASWFRINRTAAGKAARIEQARNQGTAEQISLDKDMIKTSAPDLDDHWSASMIIGRRHSA
jgi:hypothetical protein